MVEDRRFKQLERRTYLRTHQDGLIDIIIGLCVMGFGLSMFSDSSAFSILAWMPIVLLPALKNRITVPRLGYAQFDRKRTGPMRLMAVLMVLGLVMLLAGVFVFIGVRNRSPEMTAWLKTYLMVVLAAVAAFVMVLSGWMSGIKRLHAYAALTLMVVAGGDWLGVEPPVFVLVLGALIMVSGLVLLARFLLKYPAEKGEENDGAA